MNPLAGNMKISPPLHGGSSRVDAAGCSNSASTSSSASPGVTTASASATAQSGSAASRARNRRLLKPKRSRPDASGGSTTGSPSGAASTAGPIRRFRRTQPTRSRVAASDWANSPARVEVADGHRRRRYRHGEGSACGLRQCHRRRRGSAVPASPLAGIKTAVGISPRHCQTHRAKAR